MQLWFSRLIKYYIMQREFDTRARCNRNLGMIFTQERLDQGAQLAVAHMPHVESVSVGFWLGVGGRQESRRQNGIFHFLEHMLFKGTTKRTAREISEAVEGVGGYLNAFTAEEMTCYYARASATHLRSVVDVLTDMLLRATFPAAEIERERGVIQEEIRMYEDQPSQLAQDMASSLLWPNHPLGRPLLGTSEIVQRMKRRDLLNYRRKFYHSGNLCITVAGKTDLAEVKELLRPLLRQFPTGPRAMFTPGFAPADRAALRGRAQADRADAICHRHARRLAARSAALGLPADERDAGREHELAAFPERAREAWPGLFDQHRRELLPGNGQLFTSMRAWRTRRRRRRSS